MNIQTLPLLISGPGLNRVPCTTATYTNQVNKGVTWSAVIPRRLTLGWDPTALWTIYIGGWQSPPLVGLVPEVSSFGEAVSTSISGMDLASFYLTQEGLSFPTLHNMLATDILTGISNMASITGNIDMKINSTQIQTTIGNITVMTPVSGSSTVSVGGLPILSLPRNPIFGISTITGGTSAFNINYLGGTPLSSMRVEDYDIQGGTLADHFSRLIRDAACNWRVNSEGAIEVFPMNYASYSINPVVGAVHQKQDLGKLYTQIWLRKRSKARGVFGFPWNAAGMAPAGNLGPEGLMSSNISISVLPGSLGSPAFVAFFTGPNGTGSCCGYFAIDPTYAIGTQNATGVFTLTGPIVAGVAMSCKFYVESSAQLGNTPLYGVVVVHGTPPSVYGYDPTFVVTDPPDTFIIDPITNIYHVAISGDTAKRQRHLVVESSTWPSQSWVTSNNIAQLLLWEYNKFYQPGAVSAEVVNIDPTILPGGIATPNGLPTSRFDTVTTTVGVGSVSQTISGFAVPW